MKLKLEDILRNLYNEETVTVYAAQMAMNKYEPFNKAFKRIEPVKVQLSLNASKTVLERFFEELKYNNTENFIKRNFDNTVRIIPFAKNGVKLLSKHLSFRVSAYVNYENSLEFFSDYESAVRYWNKKIEEHTVLMEEELVILQEKKDLFAREVIKL